MKKPTKFRPMLAAPVEGEDKTTIKFPVLATPKIDGIRCLMRGKGKKSKPVSRALKKIPNRFIRKTLKGYDLPPFDGELAVGTNWSECTSGIMTEDGKPDFIYYVFDVIPKTGTTGLGYQNRVAMLNHYDGRPSYKEKWPRVRFLIPTKINNLKELKAFLDECLMEGYEGIVWRSPDGPYKHGRSTFKQGFLTKWKPFEDDEAKIIGFEELHKNGNKATKSKLGLTERSSHQENLIPMNTLGAFVVKSKRFKKSFKIGTFRGLTHKQKKLIWKKRHEHLGRVVKYQYQLIGIKDKPRIPTFLGFRDPRDL